MFDAAVAKVLKTDSNAIASAIRDEGERPVQRAFIMSNQDAYALSFLDLFFQGFYYIILYCIILLVSSSICIIINNISIIIVIIINVLILANIIVTIIISA
jgi:hypothetical protein